MADPHPWPFAESRETRAIISYDILHDRTAVHRVDYDEDAEWAFLSRTPGPDDDDDWVSVCLEDAWLRVRGLPGLREAVAALRPGHCLEWDPYTWTWHRHELVSE
ncbi:hypothetical protein [Nonomuraea rubra]|uniref:hypothetical protein n=1 Tax=Nonomuraea rubra TaxID=46180 RepID=UPI0033D3DFF8